MSLLQARVSAEAGGFWLELGRSRVRAWSEALEPYVGRIVSIGVRPENVTIGGGEIKGRVAGVENLGSHQLVTGTLDDGESAVARIREGFHQLGESVSMEIDTFNVFDAVTGEALST